MKRTDEEKPDVVDTLDTFAEGSLRNPRHIINGVAAPLVNSTPAIDYAISMALAHALDRRAKDLCIPETFQQAIDVWEFEVDNAVAFMLENFNIELVIFACQTIEKQYGHSIMNINKPNVHKLNDLIKPFLN